METNLSNVHLLNEEVSHNLNAETLKQQRMEQVSKTANNPIPPIDKNNVIPMNPNYQNQQQNQPQNQQVVNENNSEETNFEGDEDNYNNSKANATKEKEKKNTGDDKILGMSKPVFYLGLAALVGIGGYFAYRHFKNKKVTTGGKSKTISSPSAEVAEGAASAAKSIVAPPSMKAA